MTIRPEMYHITKYMARKATRIANKGVMVLQTAK